MKPEHKNKMIEPNKNKGLSNFFKHKLIELDIKKKKAKKGNKNEEK